VEQRVSTGRKTRPRPLDISQLERLGDHLGEQLATGHTLHLTLLPKLAPQVYMHFYGVDAGARVVVPRPDGSWPPRPTDDDTQRWLDAFDQKWGTRPSG
jgi:hypothetical protein